MRISIPSPCQVLLGAAILIVALGGQSQAQSRIVTPTDGSDASAPLSVPEASDVEAVGFTSEMPIFEENAPCDDGPRYWYEKSPDPDLLPFHGCCRWELIRNQECQDDCFDRCDRCDNAGLAECQKLHALGRHMLAKLHCKLGYFTPTGSCGAGTPWFDCYHMCYSVNPEYFDPRDGRVYAAASEGVPMAVPLAPNVNHTYNYGWGIPSSRLTPISRFYPEHGYIGR